ANLLDQRQDVALPARTAHAPENAIFAVLQGHIDVLADFRVGSDRLQKLFVESTRIEIMKANPAYPFHFGNAVQKGGEGRRSIQIHSVVAGVLSDQDHLPHPLRSQLLHLAHNAFDASAAKRSAHDGDTAKSAGVVTPLGNFDMGKMAGSQPLSRESPFIRKNGVAYKHRPSTRNGLGNHLRDPGKIARPHDSVNL